MFLCCLIWIWYLHKISSLASDGQLQLYGLTYTIRSLLYNYSFPLPNHNTMWPNCVCVGGGGPQFHRHIWSLDQIKNCVIWLAIASHKDCVSSFNFVVEMQKKFDVKVIFFFFISDHIGPLIYVSVELSMVNELFRAHSLISSKQMLSFCVRS